MNVESTKNVDRSSGAAPGGPRIPRDQLEGLERVLVPLGDWINESPTAKSMIQVYMRHVPGAFVESVLSHRWQPDGLEKLQNLHAERGAILVSNHRSFFDMFATGALFYRRLGLFERLYFPVRAPFWYTNALGALINLGLAGYSMWPPVFRDDRRRHVLNPIGIDQLLNALREPNACVGIHPEGARNKSADPWALMPARPGVGQLVRRAHPDTVVIPFFILIFIPIPVPAVIMIGLWFVQNFVAGLQTLGSAASPSGGVAWFAHIGGFVFGLVVAAFARPWLRRPPKWRRA